MTMKALITDPIDSSGPELLASKGVEITTKIGLSAAEIEKIVDVSITDKPRSLAKGGTKTKAKD